MENGADLNEAIGYKDLPLNIAIKNNKPELVEIMLRYNPDLNKKNYYDTYPFNLACRNENVDILNHILDYIERKGGVDMNRTGKVKKAPI